jgi:hypothetical protein
MYIQHGCGYAEWTWTCSMHLDTHRGLGHTAWTCSCSMNLDNRHVPRMLDADKKFSYMTYIVYVYYNCAHTRAEMRTWPGILSVTHSRPLLQFTGQRHEVINLIRNFFIYLNLYGYFSPHCLVYLSHVWTIMQPEVGSPPKVPLITNLLISGLTNYLRISRSIKLAR